MSRLLAYLFRKITGKSNDELSKDWALHYFLTRSRVKAYWRTLRS